MVFGKLRENFKGVSEKLHGCFMKVTSYIEGCFEGAFRVFHESFMEEVASRMFFNSVS